MMSQKQPYSESSNRNPGLLRMLQSAHLQKANSARQIALNNLSKLSLNSSPCRSPILRFRPTSINSVLDKRPSRREEPTCNQNFIEPKVPYRACRNLPTEPQSPESSFFISPRLQIDKRKIRIFRSKEKANLTEESVDNDRPNSVLNAKKGSTPEISFTDFRRQSNQNSFLNHRSDCNESFLAFRKRVNNLSENRANPLERKFTAPCSDSNERNNFARIKKVVILRKVQSKSPEGPFVARNLLNDKVKIPPPIIQKLGERANKLKISLNEMVTIKKIRSTENNGIIKKVLHAPTMTIFDLQEEPIKFNNHLKEWINMWRDCSVENGSFAKIYTCFWNSPEGSISVLLEPAKKGSLQDLLDAGLTCPESCLKIIAKSLVNNLQEIHRSSKVAHWLINPKEIIIDSEYNTKLLPGLARHAKFCEKAAELVHRQQKSMHKERNGSGNQRIFQERIIQETESIGRDSHAKVEKSEQVHTERLNSDEKSHYFASDVFDLGHCLLICALGDLSIFDSSNFYSLSNLKYLMDLIQSFKQTSKTWCCLLHNEMDLRKFHAGLNSTVRLKQTLKRAMENNFVKPQNAQPDQSLHQIDSGLTLMELLKSNGRFSDEFLDFLCNCTKIDPNQRPDASKIASQDFLASNQNPQGASITLAELLDSTNKQIDVNPNQDHPTSSPQDQDLNRVFDAIKLVMMNSDKTIFRQLIHPDNLQKPGSSSQKKLRDLALYLNIPVNTFIQKIKNFIFLD